MKRQEGESYEDYVQRRKVANIIQKIKQIPVLVWNSRGVDKAGNVFGRTFVRGRDQLTNSRADKNKIERRERDRARKEAAQEPTAEHPDTEIWQQELPLGESNESN